MGKGVLSSYFVNLVTKERVMERIVIEVDEAVAKKWRLSSQKRRDRISQEINLIMARELSDSKEDFIQYLNEIRSKMKERGLTEEILQKIISKEEQEASFEKLLDEVRKEAAKNGLTEENLERLLKKDELFASLDKISDEAAKNGLTKEILNEILKDE